MALSYTRSVEPANFETRSPCLSMYRIRFAIVMLVGLPAMACLPSSASPQAKAAEFEKLHCMNATPERTSQAFKDSHVLQVEPLLARVHANDVHTIGASLRMAPPKGVTAEQLNEILQCHSASMLLERNNEQGTANDPYFLPGAWLEISVKSEIGTVSVNVAADNVHDGLLVLQRAKDFARAQVEAR